ncbi:MAG: hypothetical protein ACK56I_21485 [bacterium]
MAAAASPSIAWRRLANPDPLEGVVNRKSLVMVFVAQVAGRGAAPPIMRVAFQRQ